VLTMLRRMAARLRALVTSRHLDVDFDEELAAHLTMATEDNIKKGLPPEEARRAALLRLGGQTSLGDQHRQARGIPIVEALLHDVRYAFRTLRRDAALTMFAILIVGLGVGASTTIFSVFNAVLLRPLPFEEPGRLVWIANGTSENLSSQTVQVVNLLDLQAQSESLASVAGFSPFYGVGDIRLTGTGEPERLTGVPVSADFFRVLGVQPHLGRFFTAEEYRWNAPKTVVLSHAFWQRRLGADPGVIGRALTLDGMPVTVVGVLPPSFDFAATFTPGNRAELFVPFPLSPETNRRGNTLALIGRLEPGVTVSRAQAEASLIGERIQGTLDEVHMDARRNAFRPNVSTLRDRVSGRFHEALLVLAAAVGFLMLLVCANLSNLLLARGSARQKEMAVRAALGAGRGRLIRQMLVESTTLSCAGAALGLALAWGGTSLVARLEGTSIPLLHEVRLDAVALGFASLLTVLTGVAFGLLPALQVSRVSPHRALKESSRGSTGNHGWMRRSLVIAEIGLTCMLLTGAGLLVRSLLQVLDVELGFEPGNVIAVRVDPGTTYSTDDQTHAYFDDVLRHVRAVPGVEAAGLTDALPLGDNSGWRTWSALAKEHVGHEGRVQNPLVRMIDDGYLETLQIPLLAGGGFTSADHAASEPVVVVNDTLARRLWPDDDPLGRSLITNGEERRVVGVVSEARYFALDRESGPELYLSIRQMPRVWYRSVDLVVRGAIPPASLVPDVRAALTRADPNLPATEFRTMQQLVDHSVFGRRFVVRLLVGFAGFGLVLASLGIYAVISYSVGQRRQEIGIRMALGASPGAVQVGVLRQAITLALIGLAAGLPASWMAARAMQGLLYDVQSSDPATFGAVLALLAAVVVLAGYVPARRASRIDPVAALRTD
jgi:putative ABC transport system permease protein